MTKNLAIQDNNQKTSGVSARFAAVQPRSATSCPGLSFANTALGCQAQREINLRNPVGKFSRTPDASRTAGGYQPGMEAQLLSLLACHPAGQSVPSRKPLMHGPAGRTGQAPGPTGEEIGAIGYSPRARRETKGTMPRKGDASNGRAESSSTLDLPMLLLHGSRSAKRKALAVADAGNVGSSPTRELHPGAKSIHPLDQKGSADVLAGVGLEVLDRARGHHCDRCGVPQIDPDFCRDCERKGF